MKTLGLLWDAKQNALQYNVTIGEASKITKRSILSKIAEICNPLEPVIIITKCIMQSMWQIKTGWGKILSQEMLTTWNKFYGLLPQINNMKIARNINPRNESEEFNLVGWKCIKKGIRSMPLLFIVTQREQLNRIWFAQKIGSPLKTISLSRLEPIAGALMQLFYWQSWAILQEKLMVAGSDIYTCGVIRLSFSVG